MGMHTLTSQAGSNLTTQLPPPPIYYSTELLWYPIMSELASYTVKTDMLWEMHCHIFLSKHNWSLLFQQESLLLWCELKMMHLRWHTFLSAWQICFFCVATNQATKFGINSAQQTSRLFTITRKMSYRFKKRGGGGSPHPSPPTHSSMDYNNSHVHAS